MAKTMSQAVSVASHTFFEFLFVNISTIIVQERT